MNSTLKHRRYLILILSCGFLFMTMKAQNKTSVSIKTQATVVETSGIELITIKNMDINSVMAVDGKIFISAQRDASAAIMLLKGKAKARFRVTFTPTVEIVNSSGKGRLSLNYEVYGYSSDNQSASEPIDATERTLIIGQDGKYYFWVGGKIDISNARPGSYDGEFTLQIEYI